jgi:hypothetical protein
LFNEVGGMSSSIAPPNVSLAGSPAGTTAMRRPSRHALAFLPASVVVLPQMFCGHVAQ